ncbi:DNA methyltransferase [Piscibacillus sp. B03]|uniref:DNA methyltransferase n=1 Tax=Piscibacillus sp. B03 TaxID=3457430 RepID=UPI003FCCA8B0
METKLLQSIHEQLKPFQEYWSDDKTLNKTKVMEDIRRYRPELLAALLEDQLIHKHFTEDVQGHVIFKIDEFIEFFRSKEYWANSYTKFSNEIGLSSEGKYLRYNSDVVLDFPHKDTVLEGGMTKEEVGKDEVYYHNVIAKEEIDTLLSSKVLTNAKRYTKDGEEEAVTFSDDDNLILKGNNLVALNSIKERYSGRVKAIFIDPPYFFNENKPADTFAYNSNFKLSSWLTFMKNRLEIARELLDNKGVIYITISSEGAHYLKVMADNVFDMNNFIADITWQSRKSVSSDGLLSVSSNHVLVYAKNKEYINKNEFRLFLDVDGFTLDDHDGRGPYKIEPFDAPNVRKNLQYPIKNPNSGEIYHPPEGRCWRTTEEDFKELLDDNRIRFGTKGLSKPQLKVYLSEAKEQGKGKAATTLWNDITPDSIVWNETSTTTNATKHQQKLFGKVVFKNPKPEDLVSRALQLSTEEHDIVLDFFMGSATTQAVAHKMNRRYIGIEQMDYIHDVSIERLKKVIEGEQGGISKDVEWQGGGSFVYAELMPLNERFKSQITQVTTKSELETVLQAIKEVAHWNYQVELERLTQDDDEFQDLSLDEQKTLIMQSLDDNQSYVAYSEIDDTQYDIDESTKQFNHAFYQEGGE